MFYSNTFKNRDIAQRFVRHYDQFSKILHLQKTVRKRIFFCFSAASGTLREHLRTCYCCRKHKFVIKAFCTTLNIFVHVTVTCSSTTHSLFCFRFNNGKQTRHIIILYFYCLSCWTRREPKNPVNNFPYNNRL